MSESFCLWKGCLCYYGCCGFCGERWWIEVECWIGGIDFWSWGVLCRGVIVVWYWDWINFWNRFCFGFGCGCVEVGMERRYCKGGVFVFFCDGCIFFWWFKCRNVGCDCVLLELLYWNEVMEWSFFVMVYLVKVELEVFLSEMVKEVL